MNKMFSAKANIFVDVRYVLQLKLEGIDGALKRFNDYQSKSIEMGFNPFA